MNRNIIINIDITSIEPASEAQRANILAAVEAVCPGDIVEVYYSYTTQSEIHVYEAGEAIARLVDGVVLYGDTDLLTEIEIAIEEGSIA